jgi:ribosome recycling factor
MITQEEIDFHIEELEEKMEKSLEHLHFELSKVRAGKASTAMLNGIVAEYYGATTPINQMANVNVQDARTITIQPWDRGAISIIEKAILQSNIGITPQNDGILIRLSVPMLTEERRREFVRQIKGYVEDAKVAIRNVRKDGMEFIKKAVKDGYPEDAGKRMEEKIQTLTDGHTQKAESIGAVKEKDIMTI